MLCPPEQSLAAHEGNPANYAPIENLPGEFWADTGIGVYICDEIGVQMGAIKIHVFEHATEMLESLVDWLEGHAARNNLLLGFLYRLARRESAGGEVDAWMVGVWDDDSPKLALLQTPPRELIMVSDDHGWEESVQALGLWMAGRRNRLTGIIGPEPQASTFAAGSGLGFHQVFRQYVMQLDHLTMPRTCGGAMRLAVPGDADEIRDWMQAFFLESLRQPLSTAEATQLSRGKILEKSYWVWEVDGQIVSMAGVERPTRNGITVVLVYTLPVHRGRGYASNLVAQITAMQLRKGRAFCCLHTDADNPTSNRIYKAMGYYVVGKESLIHFDPQDGTSPH
jgi:predicted GNAT family acetyltransferase